MGATFVRIFFVSAWFESRRSAGPSRRRRATPPLGPSSRTSPTCRSHRRRAKLSFRSSRTPAVGSTPRIFFKRKELGRENRAYLEVQIFWQCTNWLSLSAYALPSWVRNDDSLFLTTKQRNQPMWQVDSGPPQRRWRTGFARPGIVKRDWHRPRPHLAPQTSPRGRRRAARRGKGVEARTRR